MTYQPDFTSCWAKLTRAKEHRDTLEHELNIAFRSTSNRVGLSAEYDTKTRQYIFRANTMPDRLLLRWRLMLGDTIHNLRGALDHLVWQLSILGNGGKEPTRRERTSVQFPILDGPRDPKPAPGDFEAHARGTLRFLLPRHRAIIEGHQPYNRWHGVWIHPFIQLRELSNEDKHRAINTFIAASGDIEIYSEPFEGMTLEMLYFADVGSAVKRGTIMARGTVDAPDPQRYVEVAGDATPFIALPDTEGSWVTLMPTLDDMGHFVASVIRDFEPLP